MLTRTVLGRTYTYSHCIGRNAGGGAGFRGAVDVALAPNGVAYVMNRGYAPEYSGAAAGGVGARVTKLTLGDNPGEEEFLLEFGQAGFQDGDFMGATSIALGPDGKIYVSDEDLHRISIFDAQGNFLSKWGEEGSAEGQINGPSGIDFDSDGNLWMVDAGNNRVQKFTKEGKFLSAWGQEGTAEGQLNHPWGIKIDRNGNVYVADWYNSRVQKFTSDGQYLSSFGAPGSGEGALRRPAGVGVDDEGDVYAVDWGENKVHAYTPDGTFITTFEGNAHKLSKWAAQVMEANPDYIKARNRVKSLEPEQKFNFPTAIEVTEDGRLVIVDQMRSRLQIYIKEKDFVDPQFNL